MCKLVIIPHIPEGKSKFAWRLAKAVTPVMTRHDDDGFGYSAVTLRDELLAEKWLHPKDAWQNTLPGEFSGLERALQGGLDHDTYRHYGTPLDEHTPKRPAVKALMLHSRFATSGGGVENSHPFVLEDAKGPFAALIHNGVVNKQGLRFEQSTCDSEGILNRMRDEIALYDPSKLQVALDAVVGYYALGVMANTYDDGWVVDVIKDDTAWLSAVYVNEIGAVLYATAPEQIIEACKKLKWKRPRVAKMRSNTRIRYSATTGQVLLIDSFRPQGWQPDARAYAHAAGQYSRAWDDDMEGEWRHAKEKHGLHKEGKVKWACGMCGRTWPSQKGAEQCDHIPEDGARADSFFPCDLCGTSWLTQADADDCDHTRPQKANVYIGEAADVQAALLRMERRDRTEQERGEAGVAIIDPTTGMVSLPDGTVLELAEAKKEDEGEDVRV